MELDPYGVTSYGISEELRSPYEIVKKSIIMYDIIYKKDMIVYMHKAVYIY